MKLKEMRAKELPELKKALTDAKKKLAKSSLESATNKDKNVKAVSNLRREIAILSGMVSGRAGGGQ